MISLTKEQQFNNLLDVKNNSAFSFLLDNYGGAINGIVRRLFPDNDVADSVFKNVFLQICKDIGNYDRTKGSLFTWLMFQTRKCLTLYHAELSQTSKKLIVNRNLIDLSYGYTKQTISEILDIPIKIIDTMLGQAISKLRYSKKLNVVTNFFI